MKGSGPGLGACGQALWLGPAGQNRAPRSRDALCKSGAIGWAPAGGKQGAGFILSPGWWAAGGRRPARAQAKVEGKSLKSAPMAKPPRG